jgi:hypothetical protein
VPVPPAELSAEYTIGGPDVAHAAVLNAVVVAALDAGAYEIDLRLEAPVDVRRGRAP